METGGKLSGWVKKQVKVKVKVKRLEREKKRPGITIRKKQSIQPDHNSWNHFVNKSLSNFDLEKWIDDLGIKYFRSIYSRD